MNLPTIDEVRERMRWVDEKVPEGGIIDRIPAKPARIQLLYERRKVISESIGLERMSKYKDPLRLKSLIRQGELIDAEMDKALGF